MTNLKNNLNPLHSVLQYFIYRFGYQIVSKPVQNTVVIDLSSKNNLTASTCLDESQTTLKVRPITSDFKVKHHLYIFLIHHMIEFVF